MNTWVSKLAMSADSNGVIKSGVLKAARLTQSVDVHGNSVMWFLSIKRGFDVHVPSVRLYNCCLLCACRIMSVFSSCFLVINHIIGIFDGFRRCWQELIQAAV
jgi:hypothetical protein